MLQITDTHLFAEKHETLLGVNTWESYQAVLEAIRAQQYEYDLYLADKVLGNRMAVMLGAFLMAIGHLVLGAREIAPTFLYLSLA
ncbi:hypothetical protein ONO39_26640, partial [Salmonella enterica subsp. enterica serovar Anatum]|nr:hypothetical protein [Salmonella enterica subsp. enterica serovar Anatum]